MFRGVRWQAEVLQRLFDAGVPDTDLHDLARVIRGRHPNSYIITYVLFNLYYTSLNKTKDCSGSCSLDR